MSKKTILQSLPALEAHFKKMIEEEKTRFDKPPPNGYKYHCKYCPHGTNCADGICVGCAFY